MAQDVATGTYNATALIPLPTHPARRFPVKLAASTTFAKGQLLGRLTATGKYGLYASGNSDGTQTAEAILDRACTTDASSNITWGDVSTGGPWGQTDQYASPYFGGAFNVADITAADIGYRTATGFRTIKGASVVILGS